MTYTIETNAHSVTVDTVDPDKVATLCAAAHHGDTAILQELLADPTYRSQVNNSINANKHTALFFACYGTSNAYGVSNAESVKLLLNAGADPLQRDAAGRLPLHYAARAKDPTLLAALFTEPRLSNFVYDAVTTTGQTPLHELFSPISGVDAAEKYKPANISACIPYLLKEDKEPLSALHRKDHSGTVSPLMLVKHYGLQAAFYQHLPKKISPKTFDALVRGVSIPGNISYLVAKYTPAYEPVTLVAPATKSSYTSLKLRKW